MVASDPKPVQKDRSARATRAVKFALRFAVSALLVGWLFTHIDITAAIRLLGTIQGLGLMAALLSVLATHGINCWRWRCCLLDAGRQVNFRTLVVSYWTSLFIGLALPTEYGGDLLRVKDVWNHTASGSAAVASVLWSRLSGIGATCLTFSFVGLWQLDKLSELSMRWLWATNVAICSALVAIALFPAAVDRFIRLLEWLPGPESNRGPVIDQARGLAANRRVAGRIAALALAAQGLMILTNFLYALALNQPVKLLDMALVVPLVTLSGLLPISLGGIGVKEGAFVVGLSALGLSREGALAIALLNRLIFLILALVGGLLFPFRKQLLESRQ